MFVYTIAVIYLFCSPLFGLLVITLIFQYLFTLLYSPSSLFGQFFLNILWSICCLRCLPRPPTLHSQSSTFQSSHIQTVCSKFSYFFVAIIYLFLSSSIWIVCPYPFYFSVSSAYLFTLLYFPSSLFGQFVLNIF